MRKNKDLTPRELEVLSLIAKGLQRREISEILEISVYTTISHIKTTYKKLGVHNAAEAVNEAYQLGILKVEK